MLILTALCCLLIIAGLVTRRRITTYTADEPTRLTDDHIRQLVDRGWIEVDEPLDFREIADEESKFREESPWEEEPEDY